MALKKGIDESWLSPYETEPDKRILRYADVLLMYAEAKMELNEIDDSVLEAARVDGATSFQTDMFVVLPLLRKIIGTTMVMAATYMLQMFDLIYITTKGGPGSTTMNLPLMLYSVYKNENNYGYSNAIGVCIVIAGVVCMTLINKAMRVNEEDY